MDESFAAYEAAYEAGKNASPVDANPHEEGTADHEAWADGFYDAFGL